MKFTLPKDNFSLLAETEDGSRNARLDYVAHAGLFHIEGKHLHPQRVTTTDLTAAISEFSRLLISLYSC